MAETKSGSKTLFELAKALGRWDNDGGARTEPEIGSDIALKTADERVLRYLGAAVIMQWNELPNEIQRLLFEDAASMGTAARRFELEQQIARFLHDHKDDE